MSNESPKEGDLRVWWIPQVGKVKEYFYVPVETIAEAKKVINLLANYDQFQFDKGIKGDYCNTGGLESWCPFDCQWEEWTNESGDEIRDVDAEGNSVSMEEEE